MKCLINTFTCYKNPANPTCIDLILTNKARSFKTTCVIETGLSDFHKMTLAIMKVHFVKQSPKVIHYRDYKYFSNDTFRSDITQEAHSLYNDTNNTQKILLNIFNKHAPIKKRHVRANQAPFMNRELGKAVMDRSRLRNKYLKKKSEINRKAYNKQWNYCVSLFRRTKKSFYNNLDTKNIVDNKRFWQTVKPLFSDKNKVKSKITLIENETDIIAEDHDVAKTFNDFFANIVPSLGIKRYEDLSVPVEHLQDPIERIIEKFKLHPSIIEINKHNHSKPKFSFSAMTKKDIASLIKSLDSKKAIQKDNVPTKIIKENRDLMSDIFLNSINKCFANSCFPDELKEAEVVPIFKKGSKNLKENYRPVSILSNINKIFETCMYRELSDYFDNIFSEYQFGFRKGISAQQCLIILIETWKKHLDNKEAFGALLTDLSKAFDCVDHELLIAKLYAYGLDHASLLLIFSYLRKRKQRVRIDSAFSSWSEMEYGVPQGSILGPFFFNVHICDLFYVIRKISIANYADDTTPYTGGQNIYDVIESLENCAIILFRWFENNFMKANSDKSHLLLSKMGPFSANINGNLIETSKSEKLLGVTLDYRLNFDEHLSKICDKASQKLSALARISSFMKIAQRQRIMKAFISSQFGYCPLVWMFCSRQMNNRINRIHERALRIVYQDKVSNFEQLLEKDNSVSIHVRNLQVLATEIFKVKKNLSPNIMQKVFEFTEPAYNFRKDAVFKSYKIQTQRYGIESLRYLGPKIWAQVPNEIKESDSLFIFKSKIKKWRPENCPCKLCKTYVARLGYI